MQRRPTTRRPSSAAARQGAGRDSSIEDGMPQRRPKRGQALHRSWIGIVEDRDSHQAGYHWRQKTSHESPRMAPVAETIRTKDHAGCRIEDQAATPFAAPPTAPPTQEQTPEDAFRKEHGTECRRRPSRGGQAFTCARGTPLQSLKEGERREKTLPLEWPPRRARVSPGNTPSHLICPAKPWS